MTDEAIRDLYIDLLQRTLSYSMWPEPLVAAAVRPPRNPVSRTAIAMMDTMLAPFGATAAMAPTASERERNDGEIWPACAHTMVGRKRLENVRFAVETVLAEHVEGDFIETGVWRGGTCIFARGILKAHGVADRTVYVADSFAGLPPPDPAKYPVDRGDRLHKVDVLRVSRAAVEKNFSDYGLMDDQVAFVEGFFEDTLHKIDNDRFSVIRLDGDMYSSTIQALDALYPKLQPGGFCIIDDYSLASCRKAVTDYREAHGIGNKIVEVDWTGVYWRKS